jgi:hypothetical protein
LTDNDRLVHLLNECTADGRCYVDDKQVFRRAYCGAVNKVGSMILKLTKDKKDMFIKSNVWVNSGEHWESFMKYLKPILDLERPERDDVFRKATKFDRPDFGSNIPFELFSALTNLHQKDQDKEEDETEKDTDLQEAQDGDVEDVEDAIQDSTRDEIADGQEKSYPEKQSPEGNSDSGSGDHNIVSTSNDSEDDKKHEHHDKVTRDEKTMSENPVETQECRVPAEFEVMLKHSKSIDEQVIQTIQDQDLIEEREQEKVRRNSIDKTSSLEGSQSDQSPTNPSEKLSDEKSQADAAEDKSAVHAEAK